MKKAVLLKPQLQIVLASTGELDKQEYRLATLRSEMEALHVKRAAASAELDRMIMPSTGTRAFE